MKQDLTRHPACRSLLNTLRLAPADIWMCACFHSLDPCIASTGPLGFKSEIKLLFTSLAAAGKAIHRPLPAKPDLNPRRGRSP